MELLLVFGETFRLPLFFEIGNFLSAGNYAPLLLRLGNRFFRTERHLPSIQLADDGSRQSAGNARLYP